MKSTLATLVLVCNVLCAALFLWPCDSVEAFTFTRNTDMCGRSGHQDPAALQPCSLSGQHPSSPSASGGNICPIPYLTSRNVVDYKGSEDEVLGEGGFGKVKRATLCASACVTENDSIDCTNPISVAQKMFTDKGNDQDNEKQLVGLQREARLMTRVACPSDASLLEHPGRRYVVQTYAVINDGTTLQECSAKTELALKIATGLQYIHAVGITHRDLHTGNILFDKEGEPAITDFGISMNGTLKDKFLSVSADDKRYQTIHPFVNPPEYVSNRAHNVISDKSDVYSLGRLFEQILYDGDTYEHWKVEQFVVPRRLGRIFQVPVVLLLSDERFLPIPASSKCKVSVDSVLSLSRA